MTKVKDAAAKKKGKVHPKEAVKAAAKKVSAKKPVRVIKKGTAKK